MLSNRKKLLAAEANPHAPGGDAGRKSGYTCDDGDPGGNENIFFSFYPSHPGFPIDSPPHTNTTSRAFQGGRY